MGRKSKSRIKHVKYDQSWDIDERDTRAPLTENHKLYMQAIKDHDITFCIGPAGTTKTYHAVRAALEALKRKDIKKIILTRPVVESGERLGFLPGTLDEKVHPYLIPLYDALEDMAGYQQLMEWKDSRTIQVAPLAYMRGVTFKNAFVILDEAQNTSVEQMKMFLTRIGVGSKVVITGDVTQIDLTGRSNSGLVDAVRRFKKIPEIAVVQLEKTDIVRHPLVQKIVEAYTEI